MDYGPPRDATPSAGWRRRADELAGEVARLTADNAALRAQLAAREHAACPRCGQSLHGEKLLPF